MTERVKYTNCGNDDSQTYNARAKLLSFYLTYRDKHVTEIIFSKTETGATSRWGW